MSNRLPYLSLLLPVSLGLAVGCERRQATAPPAPSAAPAPAAAPKEDHVDDERYVKHIRPLFSRHSCDAGSCHGTFKGGGLFFSSGNPHLVRDYKTVLERIDRKRPMESILIKKALGTVEHNGGQNLSLGECDTKRLLAWIGEQPDIDCPVPPPVQSAERFGREVAPALQKLGCAEATCHGAAAATSKATSKLDLSTLSSKGDGGPAYRAFEKSGLNPITVWMSPVIKAAWAEDGVHKAKADLLSCAYRRLHGYVAGAPEATCDLSKPISGPSFSDFAKVVMPSIAKRGCIECHSTGVGDMSLFETQNDPHAPIHDYIALTARVEDQRHPEQSTMLKTARNQEPHGGGKRLGGNGDCLDEMVVKWLQGKAVRACPPPRPPSYERYSAEIQPVLDRMTCTQAACHGETIESFKLIRHAKDTTSLRINYQAVLKQIDYDFMPFSGIQLRMREPCAYSFVAAWIEGRPKPTCELRDPDPSIFPKLEKKIKAQSPPAQKT